MDGYPINLILTVAIASATLFIGILPTKTIRPEFFAGEMLRAALAWLVVAVVSPPAILHYPLIFAVLCLAAWWQFREDNLLKAKMWLTVASALGLSVGVIVILAVTPHANPPGIPQLNEALLLASIYLGGIVIGLAYVCFALTRNANSGVTHGLTQRHIGMLLILILARAAAMLGSCFLPGVRANAFSTLKEPARIWAEIGIPQDVVRGVFALSVLLLVLVVVLLPALGFLAKRASHFSSRVQPTRILIALCATGFLAEILARLLIL